VDAVVAALAEPDERRVVVRAIHVVHLGDWLAADGAPAVLASQNLGA
jgi:hypothetical protein